MYIHRIESYFRQENSKYAERNEKATTKTNFIIDYACTSPHISVEKKWHFFLKWN
jgi:hypothetical protein